MIARMLLHGVIAAALVAGAAGTYSALAAQPFSGEVAGKAAAPSTTTADQDDEDDKDEG